METRKPIITLTVEETKKAMEAGKAGTAMIKNTDKSIATGHKSVVYNQVACAAEIAVSKFLGLEWQGFDYINRHKGDVSGYEVKSTKYKKGRLLLTSQDKKDRKYILVISLGKRQFKIVGWAYGHEVIKTENKFKAPDIKLGCWALEQKDLRPIETLGDE